MYPAVHAKENPDKTNELGKMWDAWSKDCKTKPKHQ